MRRFGVTISALALLIGPEQAFGQAASSNPLAAQAGWEVCNETSFILRLASASISGGTMTPRGWDRLQPGQCQSLSAPEGTPRYIFAESDPVHSGGIRESKGNVPLCVSDENFSADATQSCQLQNMKTQSYLAVDPAELRTTLIEAEDFGKNAQTAGIQRLLKDNGLKINRIDGLPGRRTTQTIRSYKKSAELAPDISNEELIEALALSAAEKSADVGIEFCNNSSSNVWTALATRIEGAWTSQGWWQVNQGQCLRPYTHSIQGTEAHFYALQEGAHPPENTEEPSAQAEPNSPPMPDKHLRSVSAQPSQFCIAEAKFSALGREYCAEAGYSAANFRPLPTDKDGAKVILTDTDFIAPSPVGLRR